MNKAKKSTLEELMGKAEREEMILEDEADEIILDEPKRRTWLVVLLSVLATLILAAGAYVAWQSYSADKTLKTEEKIENPVAQTETSTSSKQQIVYVNSPEGLNFRKEAQAESEVLAIIPNGTKLEVLETTGDWFKTAYENKTGWVAKLFTSESDPLVYKDAKYGFEITFPATWAYKFFPKTKEDGVTAIYYVSVPTTDISIDETSMGVDKGYASMFAISVFTPAQWQEAKNVGGPLPTVGVQNTNYVVTYSLPNGITGSDLEARKAEVKSILATIKSS